MFSPEMYPGKRVEMATAVTDIWREGDNIIKCDVRYRGHLLTLQTTDRNDHFIVVAVEGSVRGFPEITPEVEDLGKKAVATFLRSEQTGQAPNLPDPLPGDSDEMQRWAKRHPLRPNEYIRDPEEHT